MTALEPIHSSNQEASLLTAQTLVADKEAKSTGLLVDSAAGESHNGALIQNDKQQFSPLINNSTRTRIDLFHKYKQQISSHTISDSTGNSSNSTSYEDLKTYSTPPQSPPLNLLIHSNLAPLSPLTLNTHKINSQSNLMIDEDSKQTNDEKSNQDKEEEEEIKTEKNNLRLNINETNELLREKLKTSYERLRSLQARYFHSHVAEQLNKILELKEKQKLENVTLDEPKKLIIETKEEIIKPADTTTTITSIDDNSVDLLTSILKSNLNNNSNHNSNVDVAVKSLLDDIQYEILKQTEDKANKRINTQQREENAYNSATDNEDNDSNGSFTSDDDLEEENDESVFDDVNLAIHKLRNVNKKQKPSVESLFTEPNNYLRANSTESTKSIVKTIDEEKKLMDSSNLFWKMSKAQLGSNWECVQTKLKYLKMKTKQFNDYSNKCNRFTNLNNVNKTLNSLPLTITNDLTTTCTTNINPTHTIQTIAQDDRSEEAAIAALSSSLQESVAAVVNTNSISNESQPQIDTSGLSASRCIPFKNNFKSKSHSRLFNLNRNDLIKLDDDVIRSLYFTLKYFSNNYFKTMCSCSQLNKIKRSMKQKSFDEQDRNYEDENDPDYNENSSDVTKKRKFNNKEQLFTLSDMLSMNKTCIFCHLLKEYEKNRMNEINMNNKYLIENKFETNDEANSMGTNDQIYADLNLVRSDHSYCKQPNPSNGKRNNIKLSRQISNEQNELLERIVNERLSRIFDDNKNKNIFENTLKTNYEDDDQFIDAGLDLPPADLQNLPDLSYEELKFLNEIDEDSNSRKYITNNNESLEDIEICDLEDSLNTSESFLFSQSFPAFKKTNINNNGLSSSFSYKPKYRNVLKQSSNTNLKKRKLELMENSDFVLLKQTSTENVSSKRGRKKSLKSTASTIASIKLKKKPQKKLSSSSSISSSSSNNIFNVRQKRNRSTSSSHSSITSSNLSYNDSNSGDNIGNKSGTSSSSSTSSIGGHYYNYYISNPHNKFDIDNIVIPHDMLSNSKSVNIEQKNLNVPTPRWRVLDIEPLAELKQTDSENINEDEQQIEELDDLTFITRHKLKELKERDTTLKIRNKIDKVKKNKQKSVSSPPPALPIVPSLSSSP